MHLVNSNKSSLAYQSYQDSINFPKGFVLKFKTFLHNINLFHLLYYQNTFSEKRLLHSAMNKLKKTLTLISGKIKSMMIVKISLMETS